METITTRPVSESRRSDFSRRLLPPMFKAYSPRRDFNPANPATHGCAIQFDFIRNQTSGVVSIMLKVGRQVSEMTANGEANFDWEKGRLYTKLTVWELGHIVSVLNERRKVAEFLNSSREGDIMFKVEAHDDGNDLGDVEFSFKSGVSPALVAVIQPYQSEPLRVFIESAIERILMARADQESESHSGNS